MMMILCHNNGYTGEIGINNTKLFTCTFLDFVNNIKDACIIGSSDVVTCFTNTPRIRL